MYCKTHIHEKAAGGCIICGALYCRDCLLEISGKFYCKHHALIAMNKKSEKSEKSKSTAFILCLFFGCLGIHRFYIGKVFTGIIYLFTFGLFGIGAFVDLIRIFFNNLKDHKGLDLQ